MHVIERTINRLKQQNNNQLSAIAKAKGNTCKPSIHNNSATTIQAAAAARQLLQTIMLTTTLVGQCEQEHPNAPLVMTTASANRHKRRIQATATASSNQQAAVEGA